MATNDGGPAFPQNDATVNRINNHDGMSLRDYFAGQALVGQLAGRASGVAFDADMAATCAYLFADAMLAARGKP